MKFRKAVPKDNTFLVFRKESVQDNIWNTLNKGRVTYDKTKIDLSFIEEALKELFYGKDNLTYDDLKGRILKGYSYKIGSNKDTIYTGSGGVLLFIESCERIGVPPHIMAEGIYCHIGNQYINIMDLKIKKIE